MEALVKQPCDRDDSTQLDCEYEQSTIIQWIESQRLITYWRTVSNHH